ncbi:MAG TPA: glycosyltransferase family 4 protein [Vicinamibacteria bacterium]|nr:glycosyltransferase family 4 protein [Vicinamibacteria bacterium]
MTAPRPRILFVSESFWPVLGGGETHIRDLAGRLVARGFGAHVLTRRTDPGWASRESAGGVEITRVGPVGPGRTKKYALAMRVLPALCRLARGCDVLVVRGTRVLGLPGLLAGSWANRPVVLQPELNGELSGEVYTWGTALHRSWPRRLVGALVRVRNLFFRDAAAAVAMSRLIADEMARAGFPPERIAHIAHGVDTGRFSPRTPGEKAALREGLGLPADGLVVTYTGRLLRGKGLEALLDAFARVAASEPRAHLMLVGSGAGQALSNEGDLRARVARMALDGRVTFTGRVDAVEDCLGASDVFAFPSEFEALGLSLIEAAACGLPCVGTRTGGIVDVIEDGRTGLLVPPSDVHALAAALEALLRDPERRSALGARARARAVERFDVERSLDRYHALFHELSSIRR